jgi:hypothetical protein
MTVSRRIGDRAEDLCEHLFEKIRNKAFAIQLDKTTYSATGVHLIMYVSYSDKDKIKEDLLFCKEWQIGKAEELFNITDNYMTTNLREWSNGVGPGTDGASSMSGIHGRNQSPTSRKFPCAVWAHCMIHRQALASEYIRPKLQKVLEIIINVVNYIITTPLKARIFARLCEEMGAEHISLIFTANQDSCLWEMFYNDCSN